MPETYVVNEGDCLASLAHARGLTWQRIWNHGENSNLKSLRKDPNVLNPGDAIYIPDIEERFESRGADSKHKFVKKGTPAKVRVRIFEATLERGANGATLLRRRPCANKAYTLTLDGGPSQNGSTDGDGKLEAVIRPDLAAGTLILEPGTARQTAIPMRLGCLDPIAEFSGVVQRLVNLGYDCAAAAATGAPEFQQALRSFQQDSGMDATGNLDEATRNKIKDAYGI